MNTDIDFYIRENYKIDTDKYNPNIKYCDYDTISLFEIWEKFVDVMKKLVEQTF